MNNPNERFLMQQSTLHNLVDMHSSQQLSLIVASTNRAYLLGNLNINCTIPHFRLHELARFLNALQPDTYCRLIQSAFGPKGLVLPCRPFYLRLHEFASFSRTSVTTIRSRLVTQRHLEEQLHAVNDALNQLSQRLIAINCLLYQKPVCKSNSTNKASFQLITMSFFRLSYWSVFLASFFLLQKTAMYHWVHIQAGQHLAILKNYV